MSNSVERFSNRVANYVKYRPDYPREIIAYLSEHAGLTPDDRIADVGCGPGISSRMFLENGNRVVGVEPNDTMRAAAIECLKEYPNFTVLNGTSNATGLEAGSIDLVVAAQAFHWFDPQETRAEFGRILKPEGGVVLMWNERQLDSTLFLREYEEFLVTYSTDYSVVRHENITTEELDNFFRGPYSKATFANVQVFDLKGLKGRMLSASYMPDPGHMSYTEMIESLAALFAKHEQNGRIEIFYDTNIYYSRRFLWQ